MKTDSKSALLLGGSGLVGKAVAKQLIENGVKTIILVSRSSNIETKKELQELYPQIKILCETGNIILPSSLKDKRIWELEKNSENKKILENYFFSPLTKEVVTNSFIYFLIHKYKPNIIVDSVNMASQLSYATLFSKSNPLHILTRYMQVLYIAFKDYRTNVQYYVKIGTSGTGGMGLNIPYTHGETQPSQELLMKSAVAGAQTQLLYLFSRTPHMPVIIEIKPAAAIAWGNIGVGELKKGNKSLKKDNDYKTISIKKNKLNSFKTIEELASDKIINAPYIDSGENGLFSLEEFRTITHLRQMEFVTPEEIAEIVCYEISGKQTGHDMISTYAQGILGPTYQAGYLRENAIAQLKKLVDSSQIPSVAFEFLGPPRLTKLLYEAYLIQGIQIDKDIKLISSKDMQRLITDNLMNDKNLLLTILSTGIPVLLNEELVLIRGSKVLVKPHSVDDDSLNWAAHNGWIDLRINNLKLWQYRLKEFNINKKIEEINPGNLAAFIFETEQQGKRIFR